MPTLLRYATTYGALAGAIAIATIIIGMSFDDGGGSETLGYLIMIVALSAIFVAVKRYRDQEAGGVIKFLPAFGAGLSVAVTAAIVYVAVWEIYLNITDFAFVDDYAQAQLAAAEAKNLSEDEMQTAIAEIDQAKALYANPVLRLLISFLEIFPVGFIIALVSALLLRNPKLLPAR